MSGPDADTVRYDAGAWLAPGKVYHGPVFTPELEAATLASLGRVA